LDASCGGLDHEPIPLSELVSSTVTAKLSVPDTLESTDGKHENARPAGALLSWTGDPKLGLPPKRAQRLDPSGTPAGSSSHQGQNIAHLIVINADD